MSEAIGHYVICLPKYAKQNPPYTEKSKFLLLIPLYTRS